MDDLAWCVPEDRQVDGEIIKRKIGLDEIIVADLEGKKAGLYET